MVLVPCCFLSGCHRNQACYNRGMQTNQTIPLLQLHEVCAKRPDQTGNLRLLVDRISCSMQTSELTALVGPSGSGKSTLIRLINRLEDPSSGEILLQGSNILALDPLILRRQVGMMLQKAYMFSGSVLDNLQLPFKYRKQPLPGPDDLEILRCLKLARLTPDYLLRDARSLSGGEQQRVNLARALITHPRVLLLDEPTSALDRPTTDSLGQTLHEICRSEQMAVVMVTHDLRLARRISDQLLFMEQGRLIESGRTANLFTAPQSEGLQRFLAEPEGEE